MTQKKLQMEEKYTLVLTGAQIALIAQGLGAIPYARAAPIVAELERQLHEEQTMVKPVSIVP